MKLFLWSKILSTCFNSNVIFSFHTHTVWMGISFDIKILLSRQYIYPLLSNTYYPSIFHSQSHLLQLGSRCNKIQTSHTRTQASNPCSCYEVSVRTAEPWRKIQGFIEQTSKQLTDCYCILSCCCRQLKIQTHPSSFRVEDFQNMKHEVFFFYLMLLYC